MSKLPDLLFLGLVPAVVHLEFSAEHHGLPVRLVDVVDARLAFVGDKLTVGVDVAGQDSASFVVSQLVVDVLEVSVRMDLRLESWHGRCRRCCRCGSVVGLMCRCIIFRQNVGVGVRRCRS